MSLPRPWVVTLLSFAGFASLVAVEMHTAYLQSRWLSHYASKLTWDMVDGACDKPMPALAGPYDVRLGYARQTDLRDKLTARDFVVERQACPSPELYRLAKRGIAPPYREKDTGSLHILDRDQKDLYRAKLDRYRFADYQALPALLVESLLYVENRQLLDLDRRTQNPALEWDRLFLAGANYAFDKVSPGGQSMGGSTLATQIEKFRHSPAGRTSGGGDKLRQLVSASLRAYRNGPDTRTTRRHITLDYVNSMPLGAAAREGEIIGLGHGMWAWFGKMPSDVIADLTLAEEDANLERKAETFKQTLALIMSTRRPSLYLSRNRQALDKRIEAYLPLLVQQGIVSQRLARATRKAELRFRDQVPEREKVAYIDRKATNAVRTELLDLLDAPDLYALDRYDLRVETSIDAAAQERVTAVFRKLANKDYLARNGFYGERMLQSGNDPERIVYAFSLYESMPRGNRLRVSADNLNRPLDFNRNVKLELGSTAKLRTMANYLMVVASLYERYQEAPREALESGEQAALDPITLWTARYLRGRPDAKLEDVLQASLDRPFSTDAGESFFTGRGMHTFANFNDDIQGMIPLRTAFQHSVNLCYIRLMRELVQYYTAELDFNQAAILADLNHPKRKDLLEAAMLQEARENMATFYGRYRHMDQAEALRKMCGKTPRGLRRLAAFYLTEHPNASLADLRTEARRVYPTLTASEDSLLRKHHKSYAGKSFNVQDEAYLLGRHPLEVWLVRDRGRNADPKWSEVMARSVEARAKSTEWIHRNRFKSAQNTRIRIELERRAFVEIHKAWKQLGYPFDSLVPSLATSIGSSADRPQALAELVGIIQNAGRRAPFLRVESLHFAEGTPYEMHLVPTDAPGDVVMQSEVATSLKGLMLQVVEGGTARRVHGALQDAKGRSVAVGGKTGSGDNRYEKFASDGSVLSSRAINRTASFVFVAGDRYFGMVSAYVEGEEAENYRFTSSLALQTFKMLTPAIAPLIREERSAQARTGRAPADAIGVAGEFEPAVTTAGAGSGSGAGAVGGAGLHLASGRP